MDKISEIHLPKRKPLRLPGFDYGMSGAYFITICVKERKPILSSITKPTVGVGALDDPHIQLSKIGKIVEKNLLSSENISGVIIDQYVIMPDHLHAIIFLDSQQYTQPNGSSWAPTPTNKMLPHIVSTFKRFCAKELGGNVFQRGYIEHIVRDGEDYAARVKYILENPRKWYEKHRITEN